MAIFGIFDLAILINFLDRGVVDRERIYEMQPFCGTMIYEKIYYETKHFWVWKCVYCGEYIVA